MNQELFNALETAITRHNKHYTPDDDNKIMMDKAVFLLDQISYQKSIRKDDVCPNGYIRIPSLFLNTYLQKELKKYKTFLTQNQFIKVKPYSQNQSYGYKICYFDRLEKETTKKGEYHLYEFISKTYQDFLLRSAAKHDNIEHKKTVADRNTKHLTKWINEQNIQIDWQAAFRYINTNTTLSTEQKEQYSYSLNRIRFHQWYYSRSAKDNRLHSNLTNLPSELRKFLSHKSQKLVSLDIKTSQPYLLAGVFNLLIEGKTEELDCLKKGLRCKLVKDRLSTVMNSISLTPIAIIDFKDYINLVCSQDIYTYISTRLSPNFINSIKFENNYQDNVYVSSLGYKVKKRFKDLRSYCKMLVLEYMYCSTENNSKRLKEIKQVYPNAVNQFIYDFKYCKELKPTFKRRKKRTKREREKIDRSKKLFSKFLQQLEAFLILDVITKELARLYKDMFMATIHDSIIVPKSYEIEVKDYLTKKLFEILGVKPEIKIEEW